MTPARAVVYIGGAVVLGAWLAAAATTSFAPRDTRPPVRAVATTGTERLAADVQAQSARLRERLAAAPVPRESRRNPFAFAARELPPARAVPARPPAALPAAPLAPREPELTLVGVAEDGAAVGLVRTAMIVGPGDELFMLRQGQTLLGRYTVAVIGADAVDLTDTGTGLTRRLALR